MRADLGSQQTRSLRAVSLCPRRRRCLVVSLRQGQASFTPGKPLAAIINREIARFPNRAEVKEKVFSALGWSSRAGELALTSYMAVQPAASRRQHSALGCSAVRFTTQ